MSDAKQPPSKPDRDMLLAGLALNLDFVTRDDLQKALQEWAPDGQLPLSRALVERGMLSVHRASLLEQIAEEFVAEHDGDASLALASLCSVRSLGLDIDQLVGPALRTNVSTLMGTPSTLGGAPATALPLASGPVRDRRFRPIRLHARGALGQVFVAVDEELNREVALKEMQEPYAGNAEGRARFLAEAEITGQLEHPGIVPVYGLGKHPDGRPYYAMRFIRGESLHDAITRYHSTRGGGREGTSERALALRALLTRFVAVCNAVAYAHSRGVIHRDLKPANIMLGPYGETLVVDWGLAKAAGRPVTDDSVEMEVAPVEARSGVATSLGLAVGTPAYMPPEQAAGKLDQVGPASDVYALGATLYHLLTGELPFEGETAQEILMAVRLGRIVPPRKANREVPAPLEAIVLKAMAYGPEARYQSAHDLSNEIERWLADEPVQAYAEPLWERGMRWARHNRPMVAGLAALVLTAIVGLTAGLYAVGQEQVRTARQRDVAEGNLKLAQKAVNKCFVLVTEEPPLQGEKMKRVRELLLREALPFYEGFRSQRPDDEGLKEEEGTNLYRVGRIMAELGKKEEALQAYARARDIFSGLADDTGRDEYRANVALIWGDLGKLHREAGERDKARRAYQEALALREALARSGEAEAKLELAKTRNNLGALDQDEGDLDGARDQFQKVQALAGPLARENAEARNTLGTTAFNLGVLQLLDRRGHRDKARRYFKQACDARQQLVRPGARDSQPLVDLAEALTALANVQEPKDAIGSCARAREMLEAALAGEQPQYLESLARVQDHLGTLLRGESKAYEAEQAYKRALDVRGVLAKEYPDKIGYRADLVGTCLNLAQLLRESGRIRDALALYERALKEMPGGSDEEARRTRLQALEGRANARAREGDDEGALADAVEAEKANPDAGRLYELACVWSLCSAKAVGPEKKRRGARAVALLTRAREAGLFKNEAYAKHVHKDEDLKPLKGREDFENFLKSVPAP